MRTAPCTFDDSLTRAVGTLRQTIPDVSAEDVRFVRDMIGQLHILVPESVTDATLDTIRQDAGEALGPYSPGMGGVMRFTDALSGSTLMEEPTLIVWVEDYPAQVIERRAIGQDWVIHPRPVTSHPPRFVFYSLKGGVGRSTALLFWARHLVQQGKVVLVVDLDLEAPGLGAQLLPEGVCPLFGVMDWLVEDLVGENGTALASQMTAESPVADGPGLMVAPAMGSMAMDNPQNVIAKLARACLESESDDAGTAVSFAGRLQRMFGQLENKVEPDVVLIDSRAGLHETAAANLLHLDAQVLLFAEDLPVTWQGYRYLFGHLQQLAGSTAVAPSSFQGDWRARFKMVHARASGDPGETDDFVSSAYSLWANTLYDHIPPPDDPEVPTNRPDDEAAFSFDQGAKEAPHYPVTILQNDRLERLNPLAEPHWARERAINEAMGLAFDALAEMLESLMLPEDGHD